MRNEILLSSFPFSIRKDIRELKRTEYKRGENLNQKLDSVLFFIIRHNNQKPIKGDYELVYIPKIRKIVEIENISYFNEIVKKIANLDMRTRKQELKIGQKNIDVLNFITLLQLEDAFFYRYSNEKFYHVSKNFLYFLKSADDDPEFDRYDVLIRELKKERPELFSNSSKYINKIGY